MNPYLSLNSAEALNSAMARVYGLMGFGLLLTTLVAMFTHGFPAFQAVILGTSLKWVVMFAPLGFVLVMSFGYAKLGANTLRALFITFAGINGLSLSAIINVYDLGLIIQALFSTIGLFGALSVWGYFTKKDLSSWGTILLIGLIGLIIAMVVNMFVGGTLMSLIVSCVAVLLFLGLTAHDTQRIRDELWQCETGKAAIMGALSLYLNFLNLFLHLLNILGIWSKDD